MESLNYFLVTHDFFDSSEVSYVNIVPHSQVMLDVFFIKDSLIVFRIIFGVVVFLGMVCIGGCSAAILRYRQPTPQGVIHYPFERHLLLAGLLSEGVREVVIYCQRSSHITMMLIQAPGVKAHTGSCVTILLPLCHCVRSG